MWTSAGVTAGIDVALALVEDDHGVDVAETCARWLVMFLRRPGTQSQFAAPVWRDRARDEPIRRAQELIEADPGADHRLGVLARRVALSERHFLRRFTAELGITPARYVADVRVDAARRELEDGADTVAAIAARVGFGTAESMRRTFVRDLGTPPDDYRRRFTTHRKDHVVMTSIAIPLFPRFTALDGIGPYEVLQRIPGYDVTFVGHERGPVRSENGFLGIEIDATFDELAHPDVVVFPGGVGTRPLVHDERVLDWVRTRPRDDDVHDVGVHRVARARRRRAARRAHRDDALGRHGLPRRSSAPSPPTSASSSTSTGGSSRPPACRAASTWRCASSSCSSTPPPPQACQLMIEYDPQPPFDAGSVAKAGDVVMARAAEYAAARA